ncbi:family 78 glycoside hydrolase catalytic domain [Catenuloplanes atrovinosus]|uniref:alpha-L-rhamnosidase n=1 Tax=Catenuloplanes atrovinosus TaxID=137266 RepID=A0AAE4C9E2_9ACTN|nr:family 78 glycoside hydrolase catalytic domain [Catenuloplanes atrovinosus]MDR7275712.1 alpha-L-rhamnosidase [Catenuloplanes atrovinosus]
MKRRTALGLSLAVPSASVLTAAPALAGDPGVRVVSLRVDGRGDAPLGLDNPHPVLSWQFAETTSVAADRQTAYQIRVHDAARDRLLWDSGRVDSPVQSGVRYGGPPLVSRQRLRWQVRAWDAGRRATDWSRPSTWETGLPRQEDWGDARWIEYPGRTENQPMPIFARPFGVDPRRTVTRARLYLSGVGMHLAGLNGRTLSDEVLAPGYANYQLSSEYRVYDVAGHLRKGANTVAVRLGNGPAYVRRSVTNPAAGRTAPYAWWQSQLKGSGTLTGDADAGATTVTLSAVTGYHVGGTINVDTGDGGDNLESRVITAIGADSVTFTPGLSKPHPAGAAVTGSGNNVAASDASAGAAVTPRFIARLEITYADGRETVIVSDREWRTALGPLITDAWYSGSDVDARREQPGWDRPGSDLSATATRRDGTATGWIAAGIAPPPNLATRLVARTAPPVRIAGRYAPVSITNPAPGTWVFDLGQNIAGFPLLTLRGGVPAGTTIRMSPAESLAADGTVDQASLKGGGGSRGTDLFNTYTTAGLRGGESWRPDFTYFGMQWVQVTGLPEGYVPDRNTITGLRVQADTPVAGEVTTSNARVNRIHRMAWYSFAGNMMSVFTDCPGREKLSYPADYTMPMGAIHRDFDLSAYLRTHERHLAEGQSVADTPMFGNVALKTPVYDWGYSGRFGDEINWGNAIILVPGFLRQLYGDTSTAARYYEPMVRFADYIARQKASGHIVDAALADWVSAEQTSGRITGTWGYYLMIKELAELARLTGHPADAEHYMALAAHIRTAFHAAFYNTTLRRYTADGDAGTAGATQAAQALALDAGLVPDGERQAVLDALVELVYAFHPEGDGPHLSGGTIGMAPIVRALSAGGRDDVLWDLIQEDEQPGYGYFMRPTVANPGGMTTIGERWNRGDSKNHMILAQIEEWFHAGLAGIRAAEGTVAYRDLVVQPKIVGDLTHVKGHYSTPQGTARAEWRRDGDRLRLTVTVPPNSTAQVWVPTLGGRVTGAPRRARFLRIDGGYAVHQVPSGTYTFTTR